MNHELRCDATFAWQRGYGVLTLGERQRPVAEAYVTNQKQHHQSHTTNAWLERATEDDDGPLVTRGAALQPIRVVQETDALYEVVDRLPF